MHKWACKSNINSPPANWKSKCHLIALKAVMAKMSRPSNSLSSFNMETSRHQRFYRMQAKIREATNRIPKMWRVLNQLNSFVQIWTANKWPWPTNIKVPSSSTQVTECLRLARTSPQFRTIERTSYTCHSFINLHAMYLIRSSSTLWTTLPKALANKLVHVNVIAKKGNKKMQILKDRQLPGATLLHTQFLFLTTTHIFRNIHSIHMPSWCKTWIEALNTNSGQKPNLSIKSKMLSRKNVASPSSLSKLNQRRKKCRWKMTC